MMIVIERASCVYWLEPKLFEVSLGFPGSCHLLQIKYGISLK